jgi:hypothetical protein
MKNQTFADAINGFEKYHNEIYKNYIFISKNKNKVKLAKKLTEIDYKRLDPNTNRKYNFFSASCMVTLIAARFLFMIQIQEKIIKKSSDCTHQANLCIEEKSYIFHT